MGTNRRSVRGLPGDPWGVVGCVVPWSFSVGGPSCPSVVTTETCKVWGGWDGGPVERAGDRKETGVWVRPQRKSPEKNPRPERAGYESRLPSLSLTPFSPIRAHPL